MLVGLVVSMAAETEPEKAEVAYAAAERINKEQFENHLAQISSSGAVRQRTATSGTIG